MFDENNSKYNKFIEEYPGYGYLKVRASMALEAIPVVGVDILISLNYDNEEIIFYSGKTNESGIVEKIKLPTPALDENNLLKPKNLIYTLKAKYKDINLEYKVPMYEGVCVVQNINIPLDSVSNEY